MADPFSDPGNEAPPRSCAAFALAAFALGALLAALFVIFSVEGWVR